MTLGLRMVDSVSTLNHLKYLNQATVNPGETATLYFQVVDLDTSNRDNVLGSRYMPSAAATLVAVLASNNDANTLVKSASMVFPNDDRSIWQVVLGVADTARFMGVNIQFTLNDGLLVKKGVAEQVLIGGAASPYQC